MQGHQYQRKCGIRYTTERATKVVVTPEPGVHEMYSKVIELPHLVCADQTRKFMVQSSTDNNYIMVLCNYDANAILVEPIPNRKTKTLQEATLKLLAQGKQKGYKATNMWLDNETNEEHLSMLEEKGLTVQLAPPHNRRKI